MYNFQQLCHTYLVSFTHRGHTTLTTIFPQQLLHTFFFFFFGFIQTRNIFQRMWIIFHELFWIFWVLYQKTYLGFLNLFFKIHSFFIILLFLHLWETFIDRSYDWYVCLDVVKNLSTLCALLPFSNLWWC